MFYSDALSELHLKDTRFAPLSEENLKKIMANGFTAESLCQDLLHQYNSAIPEARNDDLTLVTLTF